MAENKILTVKKKKLLDDLWENGVRVKDPNFEDKVRQHLYKLLDLCEGECSVATIENIATEARKFRQRVRELWGPRKSGTPKLGTNKAALDESPFFQQEIEVMVVPESQKTPDPLFVVDQNAPPVQRRSGPYKSYLEKLPDAQRLDRAAVRASHDGWAILEAAPKVATSLGQGTFGKAIKEMAKDLDVNPQLALDGMKNQSKY